jgi:hypothetical protein
MSVGWLGPEEVVVKSDLYVTSEDDLPRTAKKLIQLALDKAGHIKAEYEGAESIQQIKITQAAAYHLINDMSAALRIADKALGGALQIDKKLADRAHERDDPTPEPVEKK